MTSRSFVLASVTALILPHADAMKESGSVMVPANHAVFLTKFCFDYNPQGGLTGNFRAALPSTTPSSGELLLMLFDDEASSYSDKASHLGKAFQFECNSESMYKSAKWYHWVNASNLPDPHAVDVHLGGTVHPRWWYLAVVDCSNTDRVVEYSVHMTNPRQGWQREFSMDSIGLPLLIFFFVAYAAIALAQIYALTMENAPQAKHPLRVMLMACVAFACSGMLLLVISGILLAMSGERHFLVYLIAKMCKTCSKFFLMAMLMLVSQGHCVSIALQKQDIRSVSLLLAPFFFGCLLLEVWGEYGQIHNYTNDFIYCTWKGGALILFEFCLSIRYAFNLRKSYLSELEDEKRFFYLSWGSIYSFTFFALPMATLISFICGPWARAYIIAFLTNFFHCILLICSVIGLWPTKGHKALFADIDQAAEVYGSKSQHLNVEDDSGVSLPTLLSTVVAQEKSKHLLV